MITKGLQYQPGGKFLGDMWGHVVAPRGVDPGGFYPSVSGFRMRVTVACYAVPFFFPDPKLGCQLAVAPFWLGAAAMVLIFSFLGFLDSRLPLAMPLSPCRFKLTIGL